MSDALSRFFAWPMPGQVLLLVALVTVAAITDLRSRKIPNWLTFSGFISGLAMNMFLAEKFLEGLLFSLAGFGVAFLVNLVLYAIRARGAGDVKLMAAMGSIVGMRIWFGSFVVSAVTGGVASIVFSLLRKRLGTTLWNVGFILSEMKQGRPAYLGKEELDVKSDKGLRLAAGAVIAASTFIYLGVAYFKK